MSIHKLPNDREQPLPAAPLKVTLKQQTWQLGDAAVRARALQGCDFDLRRLPVHRALRWSVRRKTEEFFDELALAGGFVALRASAGVVLLTAPGGFVYAQGNRQGGYTSCWFSLWAESRSRAQEIIARLEEIAGDARMRDQSFTLDWQFSTASGLRNATIQEMADPVLLDEAYPALGEPVAQFIDRYLGSPECVLILLGPPGTGKTRLLRAILAEISRRKGEDAEVMYTADQTALRGDELFVDFITGSHDAFVIEDTDNLLRARTTGNDDMHRFLAVADGVARSQGRKIIFTTNLPNVNDIDDALVRPGRCFAVKHLRSLTPEEAARLVARVCEGDAEREQAACAALQAQAAKSFTVAQVYRAAGPAPCRG